MAKCVFCGRQTRFTLLPKGGSFEDSYPAHKKCDREFRSKKIEPQQLYVEGNNGGDYLDITLLGDGTARLEVGHTCVRFIEAIVPIEFITAALAKAVWETDVKGFISGLGFNEEMTESLVKKVKNL